MEAGKVTIIVGEATDHGNSKDPLPQVEILKATSRKSECPQIQGVAMLLQFNPIKRRAHCHFLTLRMDMN